MATLADILPKKKTLGNLLMTQSKAPIDFSRITVKKPVPKPSLGELADVVERGYGAITEAPKRLLAELLMKLPPTSFDIGGTKIQFDPKGAREVAEAPIQGFMSQIEQATKESNVPGVKQAAPALGLLGGF